MPEWFTNAVETMFFDAEFYGMAGGVFISVSKSSLWRIITKASKMSTAENQICYTQDSKLWPRGNRSRGKRVAISKHISTSRSDHQGMRYIRLVQSFQVEGQFGSHVFLVFEPLREPIWRLGRHLGSIGVPPVVLKPFLGVLLEGLDFLHSECGIIHTDLKADNLLIAFEDVRVIRNYARQQKLDPPLHVF